MSAKGHNMVILRTWAASGIISFLCVGGRRGVAGSFIGWLSGS